MSGGAASDWPDDSDIPKLDMLTAAYDENLDKVEEILKKGVHVDSADDDNVTALQIAAFMGNNLMVTRLLDYGADIEMASYIGMTPFLHACREGRIHVIETLLQRGADIHKTTDMGASGLTLASAGGHIEVVKKLVSLRVGGVQNASFPVCPTPMITAALYKNPQICGFLSHRGFKIDDRMDGLLQLTALSCAVLCNLPTVVSALMDLGADPQKMALRNKSAEELAENFGSADVKNVVFSGKRVRDSRPRDVRYMIKDNTFHEENLYKIVDGAELTNLLAFSVSEGNLRAVKALSFRIQSLTTFDNRTNLTPLQVASLLKKDECALYLLNCQPGQHQICDGAQFTAFDYLLKNGDQDNALRASIHFGRPKKLERSSLSSSGSTSLSRMLPNMGKDWISKMSSQILNTEVDPTPRSTDQYDFLIARMNVMHAEGRNNKKFIIVDQLLKTTRNLYPKKKITNDSQLDAIRNMATESQRFMITTFYDLYVSSGRGEDESASDKHRTHEEYDNALLHAQQYGYPEKQRMVRINPRDSIIMHRRDGSDGSDRRVKPRTLSFIDSPTNQRTTPRMLKKPRESMIFDDRADSPTVRTHASLSRMASTPTLQVPTVLSNHHHLLSRSSGDCRKQNADSLTSRVTSELRQRSMNDVIRIFEENEIDGESFLLFKEEDYRNIRISDPAKIQQLRNIQAKLNNLLKPSHSLGNIG